MRYTTSILFILFAITGCTAQDADHFTLWTRLRVTKTFSPKWEAEIDLHYRRQDNDNLNILALPLAHSVRFWAYYNPAPKWTIGFSPFTWFQNYSFPEKKGGTPKEWNEYRIYIYGEYKLSVARKLILFSRAGAEPLWQERSWGNRSFTRLRFWEQVNLQLWPAIQIFAGGELFLNTFASEQMSFYNQGRGFAGIQYHISKRVMLTGGYMFRHIYSLYDKSYQRSHDLLTGVNVHL